MKKGLSREDGWMLAKKMDSVNWTSLGGGPKLKEPRSFTSSVFIGAISNLLFHPKVPKAFNLLQLFVATIPLLILVLSLWIMYAPFIIYYMS